MERALHISLDRQGGGSLTEQIVAGLRGAIADGRLQPGARLPSWRDLAAQLGVARGTVRVAYERLVDEQLLVASGAAGTHVARALPPGQPPAPAEPPMREIFATLPIEAAAFQMGVPAQDVFPYKTWARIMARAARTVASAPMGYPDPRGHAELRAEIAAHLSISRGMACSPSQVFVTSGYAGGLGLVLHALGVAGAQAWIENPGYPNSRRALALAGAQIVPVRVDDEGLDVSAGIVAAPGAQLAVVTPGQQAPLGATLSLRRRQALLGWAAQSNAWIVEDDYLSELQLRNRAAPALASQDRSGRVIYIGTFSKTITPVMRLGFIVAPPALAERLTPLVLTLAPAPSPFAQLAVAEFLRDGHYLRHLRRMKRVYAERRQALAACLRDQGIAFTEAGLAVAMALPEGSDDAGIARRARAAGLFPTALSSWHAGPGPARTGLLLGATNLLPDDVAACVGKLLRIVRG